MSNKKQAEFFLGANTPDGFYSLYNEYIGNPSDFFFFIKSGPGCGKSSFMKHISKKLKEKEIECEHILCSADPNSLDGIYFPKLNCGILDATAPHILEPAAPGVSGCYINLGDYYNPTGLKKVKDEILSLNSEYKQEYAKAYCLLKKSSYLHPTSSLDFPEEIYASIRKRAKGIISREFKKTASHVTACENRRFLNGLSASGQSFLSDTVPVFADRVYIVDNELGLSGYLMEILKTGALNAGLNVISCPAIHDPTTIHHLIIPQLHLAFVSHTSDLPYKHEYIRHIRLDALASKETLPGQRVKLKQYKKAYNTVSDGVLYHFKKAKALHDEMEAVYNPHVDFDGIYSLADEYAQLILQ